MGHLGLHARSETHLWRCLATTLALSRQVEGVLARQCFVGGCVLSFFMLSLRGFRAEEAAMASCWHKKSEINSEPENSEVSDLGISIEKPNNPEETINIQIDRLPIKTAADSSGKDLFTQKAIMMGNRVRFRPICSKPGKS